jgi:Bifunctional DNA primase/polymerase, N-terminal
VGAKTTESAALNLAVNGFTVLPIEAGKKAPPLVRFTQTASSDPNEVAALWRQHPDANIGVVPGRDHRPRYRLRRSRKVRRRAGPARDNNGQDAAWRESLLPARLSFDPRRRPSRPGHSRSRWLRGRAGFGRQRQAIRVGRAALGSAAAACTEGGAGAGQGTGKVPRPRQTPDPRRSPQRDVDPDRRVVRWPGIQGEPLRVALHAVNAERCKPPLSDQDVEGIVKSANRWDEPPLWLVYPFRFAEDPRLAGTARHVLTVFASRAQVDGPS